MDPRKIKIPEVRVTAQFSEEVLEQFKASMKVTGTIPPPIVYEVEGELVLCDGLHRIQEEIEKGTPLVDVVVFEGDMVDVLTKNIFLDHLRGKHPVSEMVRVIGVLSQEHNLDSDQIREKTGLTRDYIERLLKIAMAGSAVLESLDQGQIGVGHAFELSRLPFAIQREELLAKHQVFRFQVKELHEFVDNVLKEMEAIAEEPVAAVPGEPLPPRVYQCEGCHEETEPRYLRPAMVCPDCFGELWRIAQVKKRTAAEVPDDGGGA